MTVGDAEPVETRPDVPRAGPVRRTYSSGTCSGKALGDGEQDVGALDQLGLHPFCPTDAVLLERADDERRGRQAEPCPCCEPGGIVPWARTRRCRSRSGCGAPSPARSPSTTRAPPSPGSSPGCGRSRRDVRASLRSRHRTRACPASLAGRGSTRGRGCSRHGEVVQEERELTQMEDRLIRDPAGPPARPELDSERGGRATELPRLVGEHPLGSFLLDEQARMGRPVTRPQSDRRAPERPADRRGEAPCVSRDVHRHGSRG